MITIWYVLQGHSPQREGDAISSKCIDISLARPPRSVLRLKSDFPFVLIVGATRMDHRLETVGLYFCTGGLQTSKLIKQREFPQARSEKNSNFTTSGYNTVVAYSCVVFRVVWWLLHAIMLAVIAFFAAAMRKVHQPPPGIQRRGPPVTSQGLDITEFPIVFDIQISQR